MPPAEATCLGWFSQDLHLVLILLGGFSTKVLSSVWRADKKDPSHHLALWAYLWEGPRKYRLLGALEITLAMVFVVPDSMFRDLMDYTWADKGEPGEGGIGYIAIFLLGFVADEIFVLLHLANDKIMGAVADKFGVDNPTNGQDKEEDRR